VSLTAFALKNSRVTFLLIAVILIYGSLTFVTYPSQEDPTVTIRTAQVQARFPGMSAKRIEQLITRKIEEKIREISEVKRIRSTSKAGVAIVEVDVYDRYFDLKPIWQKLRNKMNDLQRSLPDGTQGPFVDDDFGSVAAATIMLTNDGFSQTEWRDAARGIRDRLYTVTDVSKVALSGIREERVYLEIDPARIAQFGISPASLVQSLQAQNIILPGGKITSRGTIVLIEPSGNFNNVKEIGQTVIALPKSNQVAYLRDIVTIRRQTVDPPEQLAYFNGKPAIVIAVSMTEGKNIVEFGKRLKAHIAKEQKALPWGLQLSFATFQPDRVDTAISDFSSNLYQTIGVVLLVVILFLGLRTGLIVGAIVPLTMLLAIIIMRFGEIELQRVSIASLIIALGMLVDNGIVVAEDIKRRIEAGADRSQACITAGKELAIPLLTSSVTTILAFSPLLIAQNATGEYLRSLAMVILIVLLSSWVLAMIATPTLCYYFIKSKEGGGDPDALPEGRFYTVYRGFLSTALNWRLPFLAIVIAVFIGSFFLFRIIPVEFMPASDRNQLQITIDLPAGSDSLETDKVIKEFTAYLHDQKKNPEVATSAAYVAYGGPRFFLTLSPIDPDPNRAFVLVNAVRPDQVRPLKAKLDRYFLERQPNARAAVKELFLGASEPGIVQYRIIGPNAEKLRETNTKLQDAIRKVGGVRILQDDWFNRTLTIQVNVDQARARRAGITSQEIAQSLNYMFSGNQVTDYREGDAVIPIVLRGKQDVRLTMDRLLSISVYSSSNNTQIPLSQVASFDARWDDSQIRRRDQERTLTITAKHASLVATDFHARIQPALSKIVAGLPPGYRIELGGELESAGEANSALLDNMPVALAAMLVLLVWQFNSFRRMSIIALTIPLSFIGAALGLFVLQGKFSFTGLLGILSLAGIIINNAIVLIDRIEMERKNGETVRNALLNAGVRRLRPIIITTLTTVLGLLPLLLFGGDLWYGMSAIIMFGLGVGAVLTLAVVPVLYSFLFRMKREEKQAG